MGECKRWKSEGVGPGECLIVGDVTVLVQHVNEVVPLFTLGNHVAPEVGVLLDKHLPVVAELLKNLCFSATHVRGDSLDYSYSVAPLAGNRKGGCATLFNWHSRTGSC